MKRTRFARFLAALMVCAQLGGCAAAPASTASTTTAQPAASSHTAPATADISSPMAVPDSASPFAADWPVLYDENLTPSAAPFTVAEDLSNVINIDEYFLSDEAKELLVQNGFFVSTSGCSEFYEEYERNRYAYQPNYITVDSLLHTYHLYYLYLQSGIEQTELAPLLAAISTTMQAQSQTQLEALRGTEWEDAARRNLAYFTVAAALLDDAATIPEDVADLVSAELSLINAGETTAASPIMNLDASAKLGMMEDYTQYIPRSYYTQNETLERYFKAMMWYGRLSFLQSNEDLHRSALLMNLALHDSDAATDWQRIYQVTSFFAGASDDASYSDYAPLVVAAYGSWPQTADLAGNTAGWDTFVQSSAELRPAAINSIPIWEDDDRASTELAYRFMGQRFTFDGAIFAQLTFRKVEEAAGGSRRMLPDSLDIPAALGSDLAVTIMKDAGSTDYPNYDEQLQKTRTALAEAPASAWNASLYAGWLNTLRPLVEVKGSGYPQFMQNNAWATRNLASFLGSWTELKHDSALYAKQNYAEMGGGPIEESDDRGFVETEPVVFGRLAALSQLTAEGLEALGVLTDADAESLTRMKELNTQLMTIAEKELRGETPTEEEFELIRTVGGQLEHFWTQAMTGYQTSDESNFLTPQLMPAALVADVATNPEGSVLQAATSVGEIYVIVNVDGSLRLASGPVFNFYQFEQPASERMTDQDWWVELGLFPSDAGEFSSERPTPVPWSADYTPETLYGI